MSLRWMRLLATSLLLLLLVGCTGGKPAEPVEAEPAPPVEQPEASSMRGLGRLAFIRQDRLILLDEQGEREIARANPSGPLAWSADGRWLAFRQVDGETSRIMLLDATTGEIGEVPVVPDWPTSYAWAPSGSGLAVVVPGGIWVLPDLANRKDREPRLLAHTDRPIGHLTWSPDGERIAWVETLPFTDPEARSDALVGVLASEGQPANLLYRAEGAAIDLAGWWPDGTGHLVWIRPAHCNSCAADGLHLRAIISRERLVDLPITLLQRGWLAPLPEGNRLLLVQGGGRTTWDEKALAVCEVETGDCRTMDQPDDQVSLDPALSPDGSQIAFVRAARRPGQFAFDSDAELEEWVRSRTLWLVKPDGSGARQLQAAGSGIYAPAWSGDGKHLLFVKEGALWGLELATDEVWQIAELGEPTDRFGYYGTLSWWSTRIAWSR